MMIVKVGVCEFFGMDISLIYGLFVYKMEGEWMDLMGFWILNVDVLIFYLENEDVYLLKKFDYERIEKVE